MFKIILFFIVSWACCAVFVYLLALIRKQLDKRALLNKFSIEQFIQTVKSSSNLRAKSIKQMFCSLSPVDQEAALLIIAQRNPSYVGLFQELSPSATVLPPP